MQCLWKSGIIAIAMVLGAPSAFAADRYWVGATDNWEAAANWSTTNGGAGGASVPGANDLAIFTTAGSANARLRSAVSVGGILMSSWQLYVGSGSLRIGTSGLRVNGGATFRGSNKNVSIAGNVAQTGGYIIEISQNFSLSGNLIVTAGNFISTGTLIFNGNSDQLFSLLTDDATIIRNIVVNNIGGGTSDDIIVYCANIDSEICGIEGNITILNGNMDWATNSIGLVMTDGNIVIADDTDASLTLNQGLSLSGSISIGPSGIFTFPSTESIALFGSGTVTLDLNNTPIGELLLIEQSSISVGFPKVTLASDISVGTTLLLNNAATSLSLGSFTLYATGATITNYGTINEGTGKIIHTPAAFAVTNSSYTGVGSVTIIGGGWAGVHITDRN